MPNLLAETLRRSKEITLKRYEIPTFDSNAYSKVMLRTCSRLAPDAERVFAALFEWRDRVARELDESTGYVLSSAAMAQLAEHMPVNVGDVVSCLHPVPPIEYYAEALKKFPDVPVIIFSDDPKWCMMQSLFDPDRFFISQNNKAEYDMCFMSMCTHHIIANSSFSWWGAWLAKSENVIAPKVWFGSSLSEHDTSDLYLDHWEVI